MLFLHNNCHLITASKLASKHLISTFKQIFESLLFLDLSRINVVQLCHGKLAKFCFTTVNPLLFGSVRELVRGINCPMGSDTGQADIEFVIIWETVEFTPREFTTQDLVAVLLSGCNKKITATSRKHQLWPCGVFHKGKSQVCGFGIHYNCGNAMLGAFHKSKKGNYPCLGCPRLIPTIIKQRRNNSLVKQNSYLKAELEL